MIIERELMVQIGLMASFKYQVLQWYDTAVPMKDPIIMIGQQKLTGHNMWKVVMHTSEPEFTREATGIMVKNLDSICLKSELEQVAAN